MTNRDPATGEARFCRNGHRLTPDTEYVYPDGRKRQCRVCKSAATRLYLASPKGKVAQHRAGHRYEYSTKGMVRQLRSYIKRVRKRMEAVT